MLWSQDSVSGGCAGGDVSNRPKSFHPLCTLLLDRAQDVHTQPHTHARSAAPQTRRHGVGGHTGRGEWVGTLEEVHKYTSSLGQSSSDEVPGSHVVPDTWWGPNSNPSLGCRQVRGARLPALLSPAFQKQLDTWLVFIETLVLGGFRLIFLF